MGRPVDNTKKDKKWPDRLYRNPHEKKFNKEGFYIINVDEKDKYLGLKVGILIGGVLFIVMFPAWPFWAKVGLWYSLVLFLFGIIFFIIARLILFLILWTAGVDFWILPNIFDEYIPWNEAFTPVLSVEKNYDDCMTIAIRFFFLISSTWLIADFAK